MEKSKFDGVVKNINISPELLNATEIDAIVYDDTANIIEEMEGDGHSDISRAYIVDVYGVRLGLYYNNAWSIGKVLEEDELSWSLTDFFNYWKNYDDDYDGIGDEFVY